MEIQKNELEASLARALALVEDGAKTVVRDLGFERENLRDLISADDEATQSHLVQLEGLVQGLRSNLGSIREEISSAQTLLSRLDVDAADESVESDSADLDEVELSAKDAAEMRHDEPVTLGSILRSLLMANEPAQRETAKKENY